MKKFIIIIAPITVVIWLGMNMLFLNYCRDQYNEIQKKRLDIVVNYASDAAVDELVINTADLDLDYADFERMAVEPSIALDMFSTVFLKSYGMSMSRENYIDVKTNYIPMFLVASYDGYYVGEPTKINTSGAHDAIFSIKQPYLYRDGSKTYALNLGLTDAKLYDNDSLQKVEAPLSREDQREIINSNVSDAIMNTVYKQTDENMLATLYVPSKMSTIARTNPIDNVTVMAYVTGLNTGYGGVLDSFGIGGSRVTHENFVGCYIKDGVKYYSYMSKIPSTVDVLVTYENPIIAAENGYYFDLDNL